LHAAYKWFPDQKRAVPSAIISQGASIGVVVTIPALNWIITTYSWHYAFGALGFFGLLWVIAFAVLGKEGRIEQPAAAEGAVAYTALPYRDLLLNPTNIASWCAYFAAYFGLALVLSWFTPYLVKGLGFDQAVAGKLTALPFVVGFFVVLGGSWLSQRMTRTGSSSRVARGIFCGIAICCGGLALLAAPYAPNVAITIALIVAGTALPSVVYVLSPAILSEITPASQRGAVLAINSAVGTSAGIIAPYVMGSVIEGAASAAQGYSTGFTVCGVVTLSGGLIALFFLRPEQQRAAFASRANAKPALALA
jgi:predicted MFS family arabinose efflux permease